MSEPQLTVSDLKQYYYCPRVVYYHYVLPVDRRPTYKMEKGRVAQDELELLEARRKLKAYGLEKGERIFNPWIMSERLGLSGKPDLVIKTEKELFPVDFKFTRGRPYKNHLYQLGGYSLLLEDGWNKPAEKGFVYLIPQKDAVVFDLPRELKNDCLSALDEIRSMITQERFPEPPSHRARCVDCEYQNYCRDIW